MKKDHKEVSDPETLSPTLFKRLVKYFCHSPVQAKSIIANYPEKRIEENLAHIERRAKAGEIRDIGAYTLKVISDNIKDQMSPAYV